MTSLSSMKPIAFYPQLAKELGDITTAIYYQQLYFWSDKGTRKDGFIYKTKKDIEAETTIPARTQDRHRKKLENLKWLETKLIKANGRPTVHYKPLVKISVAIGHAKVTHKTRQSGVKEYAKVADSITESTTENTHTIADKSASKDINSFISAFKQHINPMISYENKTQRNAVKTILETYGLDNAIHNLKYYAQMKAEKRKYLPSMNTPVQMRDKFQNFIDYLTRNGEL